MFLKAGASLRKAIASLSGLVLSGSVTNPTLPAFLVYLANNQANVTGNGTLYTVPFDTEVYDQAGNFASNTFTAPVTGRYQLDASVTAADLTAVMTAWQFSIVTTARTYRKPLSITPIAGTSYALSLSVTADMTAGDTAVVKLLITGGAGDTADVQGGATLDTFFSGHLVA